MTCLSRPALLSLAFFGLSALHVAGASTNYPPIPPWQPDPAQRENLRRAITLMSSSTPEHRNTVRVLFYGQSITQQAWWQEVARYLRETYPHANLVIENRAIGGHAAQNLVKTAEADLYPFQPDLLIFHVYGSHTDYNQIIRGVRMHTPADVLLQTDHIIKDESLNEEMDKTKLSPKQWDPWMNQVFLPGEARNYVLCRADIHELWKTYLRSNHLKAADLLKDSVHLNTHGEWLMAELIKPYLAPLAPKPRYDPFHLKRVQQTKLSISEGQTDFQTEFIGTRLDLIFKPGATGAVQITIDGLRPSATTNLYGFTRVSAFPNTDWPLLLRVQSGGPLVEETWSLRISDVAEEGKFCRFKLSGSVTGEDGEGTSTNRFVSKSGRIIIDPGDWNLDYCVRVFKRPLPEGYVATWQSVFRGLDRASAPKVQPGVEACATVAQGLPPGRHKLELRGPNLAATVGLLRAYAPLLSKPEKPKPEEEN
jgi:hypothetical protein